MRCATLGCIVECRWHSGWVYSQAVLKDGQECPSYICRWHSCQPALVAAIDYETGDPFEYGF